MRPIWVLLSVSAIGAVIAGHAFALRGSVTEVATHISAFARPPRAADELPKIAPSRLGANRERISASRRLATYTDRRGRQASVFVARTRSSLCLIWAWNNAVGASCSPSDQFFPTGHLSISTGRLVFGVADSRVASVRIMGSRGAVHQERVTTDGGFIYDCKAYNGCACVISYVEAFSGAGASLGITATSATCPPGRN
jgi:hypothetical protein